MRKRTMKAVQKKPKKIVLSHSLCKQVVGGTVLGGGGPKNQQAESSSIKKNT